VNETIAALARVADSEEPRATRAQAAAEVVRAAGGYRWVGIYDVGDEEIVLVGHTGATPPAQMRFPVTQGRRGEAVRSRATVVGDDGAVVPVLGAESGIVIGTLDARWDRAEASSEKDVAFLEACAAVLRPLYD
jgi:putative methionine-R-sulfoxide reductase with GAF domain